MRPEPAKNSVRVRSAAPPSASETRRARLRAPATRRRWLRTFSLAWTCALPLYCVLSSSTAFAEPNEYRMAIFALESDELRDQFADRLAEQLRVVLDARNDYALQDTHVSLMQLSLAQNCDTAQVKCLSAIAHSLGVDGFVFGKVTHEGGVPAAVLRRYDLWSEQIDRSSLASFTSSAPRREELERSSTKLLTDLLGPEPTRKHNSMPELVAPVAPKLDRPGDLAPPDNDVTASRIAGYAFLGGAVLSTGMSVFSFVEVNRAEHNKQFERYRLAVGDRTSNVSDVCDEASSGKRYGLDAASFREAKSACSRGTAFEILQFVFIGSAVVSGGLAAYFLTTGGSSVKEHATVGNDTWSFHPTIARKGVGFGARMKF
jgi:hypothetical protein